MLQTLKGNKKSIVVGTLCGAVLGLGATAAHAEVWSSTKTFESGGVTWKNESFGQMVNGHYAGSRVWRQSGSQFPTGWAGVRARVYFSSGVLCDATVWSYNPEPRTSFNKSFEPNCEGYVFSQGQTRAWDGDSYVTSSTRPTPNWYN